MIINMNYEQKPTIVYNYHDYYSVVRSRYYDNTGYSVLLLLLTQLGVGLYQGSST
jgi:hypothetical protein